MGGRRIARARGVGYSAGSQRGERAMGRTGVRVGIRMVSTAGTGHVYMTTKSKRNNPDRIEMKKYDPVARKHVLYKEAR